MLELILAALILGVGTKIIAAIQAGTDWNRAWPSMYAREQAQLDKAVEREMRGKRASLPKPKIDDNARLRALYDDFVDKLYNDYLVCLDWEQQAGIRRFIAARDMDSSLFRDALAFYTHKGYDLPESYRIIKKLQDSRKNSHD